MPALAPRAALALLGFTAAASAEPAPPGRDVGTRRLAARQVEVAAVYQSSLAAGTLGAPWSLAVDAAWGITPELTLGISHSAQAQGRVRGGGGLCLESDAHLCDGLYAGGYLDARLALPGSPGVTLLARLGVDVVGPDPAKPVMRVGAGLRRRRGQTWLVAQPELAIALAERGNGNEDGVLLPVWAGVDLSPVRLWLETGLDSDIEAFADEVRIRFGVGAAREVGPVTLGLTLGFPQLFGPQNSGRLRQSALWLAWSP